MFFEEGWAPITEVTAEVFRRLQLLQAKGDIEVSDAGLRSELAISVWDICDASTKIGATGPDGTVISASKDLLNWSDPTKLSNEHVDLMAGSVGSSTLPDADGKLPTEQVLRQRYGPFLYLPVVIPTNNFQSSLTFLEDEVRDKPAKDPAVKEVAREIIKLLDSGGLVTRDIARRTLATKLSRRKFKLAWAMASQVRPDLAAPGRWLGL